MNFAVITSFAVALLPLSAPTVESRPLPIPEPPKPAVTIELTTTLDISHEVAVELEIVKVPISNPYYGGINYAYGNCTRYAALRRADAGNPIPDDWHDASAWLKGAKSVGIPTGNKARAGAILWLEPGRSEGHVAYVEKVNPDGTFEISQMNVGGLNVVSHRTYVDDGHWTFIYE